MKKLNIFISIILVVSMLFTVPAMASSKEGIDISCDGRYLRIAADEETEIALIVATYSEKGNFTSSRLLNNITVNSKVQKIDISDILSKEDNAMIKFFAWESFEGMKPLQKAKESDIVRLNLQNDGCVEFSGYNIRRSSSRVPFIVRDSKDNIVYFDQLTTDLNGYYNIRFKIKDFSEDERYTVVTENGDRVFYVMTYSQDQADNDISVTASEDTYVNGGSKADTNFGASDLLSCRYYPTDGVYDRKAYLKFNITDVPKNDIKHVYFQFYAASAESGYESIELNLYDVQASAWQENTLTYNTQPQWGEYIGQGNAMRGNVGMVDITEYVLKNMHKGTISFVADGKISTKKQQAIASREYENSEYHPKLVIEYSDKGSHYTDYTIPEYGKGVDPIENAKAMIQASTAEYIYPEIQASSYDDSEYTKSIKARLSTQTNFSSYKTRTLSELDGYTKQEEPELSIYGGNLSRKISEGTGFFETAKVDGRWTLVDPSGYQFYSVGVTNVRPADSQEAYKEIVDNYNADTKQWANEKREILFENKMNTAGGWSLMFRGFDSNTGKIVSGLTYDANVIENDNPIPVGCLIPHGVAIQYARPLGGVEGSGVEKFKGNVPPVFNPDFEEKCGEIIAEHTVPLQASPYVIGWWSDNEINDSLRMLDDALMLDPTDEFYVYTHAAAWEWLRNRLGRDNVGIWDLNDTLREEFREFVYDRYYQVMSRQFAIYAPNHLYLGNRHFETSVKSKGVFAAAKRHCDVVSYNLYKYWTPTVVSEWEQYADVPVLITEFYSSEISAAGGWIVENAADVGSFYENYTLRLLEAPNVIGWHYHSFGRFDGDSVNESLTTSAKTINEQVYKLIDYFD